MKIVFLLEVVFDQVIMYVGVRNFICLVPLGTVNPKACHFLKNICWNPIAKNIVSSKLFAPKLLHKTCFAPLCCYRSSHHISCWGFNFLFFLLRLSTVKPKVGKHNVMKICWNPLTKEHRFTRFDAQLCPRHNFLQRIDLA